MCGLDARHSTTVVPRLHSKSELENIRCGQALMSVALYRRTQTAAGAALAQSLPLRLSPSFSRLVMLMSMDKLNASKLPPGGRLARSTFQTKWLALDSKLANWPGEFTNRRR